jgi:hypothetical protein
MAKVHILNVTVHNNPATFFTPFQFEIHFECLEELQDGILSKLETNYNINANFCVYLKTWSSRSFM